MRESTMFHINMLTTTELDGGESVKGRNGKTYMEGVKHRMQRHNHSIIHRKRASEAPAKNESVTVLSTRHGCVA